MTNTQNLTTGQAAERLNSVFGEGVAYWATRLRNERKPERDSSDCVPAFKTGGRWSYPSAGLDDWIGSESARRLARGQLPVTRAGQVLAAFGVGQDGGSSTGRRLDCTITAQFDEETGRPFVQLMVANPLLVFRLTPSDAMALGADLTETGGHLDRISKGEQ